MLCCNIPTSSPAFGGNVGREITAVGFLNGVYWSYYRTISTHLDGGIEKYIPNSLEDCIIARNSKPNIGCVSIILNTMKFKSTILYDGNFILFQSIVI